MRTSQHQMDQKLNSEAQQSSSLVAQLQAMVAEREAKVRQLELEIGQLGVQVGSMLVPPQHPFPSRIQGNLTSSHFFPLALAKPHHILPGSTLATCFHLAPYLIHTHLSFLKKPGCVLALFKICPWLPITSALFSP